MTTKVMDDVTSNAIAQAVGLPADPALADLPTYGVYVVYENSRYSIVVHKNPLRYVAVDISVYDGDGDLLTDAADVYLSAINDAIWESAGAIGKGISEAGSHIGSGLENTFTLAEYLPAILLGLAVLFVWNQSKKDFL